MSQVDGLYVEIGATTSQLRSELDRAVRSTGQAAAKIEQDAVRAERSVEGIGIGLKSALAGLSFGAVATDVLGTVLQFEKLDARIARLTGSQQAFAEAQGYLTRTADDLGVEIATLTDSYAGLLSLQEGGKITQEQGRQLLEGLADASAGLGVGTAQLGQVFFGLQQALGSASVTLEDVRQVTDPLPGLFDKIATAGGKTSGAFKQMISDGKVTSQTFSGLLIKALEEYQGAAAEMADLVGGSWTRLNNAWTQLKRALAEPISDTLTPVLTTATAATQGLVENLDDVADVMTLVGGTIGAALVARGLTPAIARTKDFAAAQVAMRAELAQATGHILAKEAALRKVAAANLEAAAADQAAAQHALRSAQVTTAAAAARHAEAIAALRNTAGKAGQLAASERLEAAERALTAAQNQLAAAQIRAAETSAAATMAQGAQAGAIQRTTIAATIAARAMAGLQAAMAFVGGPIGLALIGLAGGYYLLSTRTDEAEAAQQRYNEMAEKARGIMAEMEGASQERQKSLAAEKRALLEKAKAEVAAAEAAVTAAIMLEEAKLAATAGPMEPASLEEIIDNDGVIENLRRLAAQARAAREVIRAELGEYDDGKSGLYRKPPPPTGTGNGDDKGRKKYESVIADLKAERAELGMTSKERFVSSQLRKLDATATDEQRAAVRALAETYYVEKSAIDARKLASERAAEVAAKDDEARAKAVERGKEILEDKRELTRALDDELVMAQKALEMSTLTERARRIETRLLQEEIAWREKGIPLTEKELEQKRAVIAAIVDTEMATEGNAAAMQYLEQFGSRAFDRIGSAITEMAMQGKADFADLKNVGLAIVSELMQEFILLAAINPLKNAIFGADPTRQTLGSLFSGFAEGGRVAGPGSGTSDSIPAMLSNGEYVVNARATSQHLPLLEAINGGRVPRFADGGLVAATPIMPRVPELRPAGGGGGGDTFQISIPVDARNSTLSEGQIRSVVQTAVGQAVGAIRQMQNSRGSPRV